MFKLPNSILAVFLAACAPLAAQQVPRKASAWNIQVPGGKPISLAAYKGKPILLAFILTTCTHCQHTVELLSKLQPDYASRGLTILASAIDQNALMMVPLFIRYMHPPFPIGLNDSNAALDFAGYSPARLPHMPIVLFIDRLGMVREQHEGLDQAYFGDQQEQNLRKSINALLAPSKPAPRKTTVVSPKTQ